LREAVRRGPPSLNSASESSVVDAIGSRRLLLLGLTVTALLAVFGIVARKQMLLWGLVRPGAVNVYFRLYALHELPLLLLLGGSALVAAAALLGRAPFTAGDSWLDRLAPPAPRSVGVLAALTFAVALATWFGVHHAVLLTMDEFTTDFQARIIARGQVRAMLPVEWQPYIDALSPVFTAYVGQKGAWLSQYLPGYALLKSPFLLVGLEAALNPLLAAISVVLVASISRRLWPDEGLRPWVALIFFVTSSEFLMTSGTGYSMPAHLTLNLLWAWLYQRGDVRSWGLALAVGVLALGLHNPFPHALFIAPFLLRLLRDRRWRRLAAAGAAYAVGGIIWMAWLRMANPFARAGGPGLLSMFAIPDWLAVWLQTVNLSLLFTWHAPLFGALVVVGMVRARRLDPMLADLALGVVLTLGFYLFFPLTQGHGWGYRYAYQVLGNLALLAAAGTPALVASAGPRRAQWLLAASFAVAVVVQAPLRFVQGERFIRPYAAAYRHVLGQPADVVLVHGDSIWYGRDLVRNDPFLRGQPVVLSAQFLTPSMRAEIVAAHPGRVVDLKDGELLRFGLTPWVRRER
jgi:hypothetical protein